MSAPGSGSRPFLATTGVRVRFGGLLALGGVSITVARASIAVLLGPNGAGKSTLLKVLAGELRPCQGEVRLDGRRIDGMPEWHLVRAGVARTFQVPRPRPGCTVWENVYVAALHGAGGRRSATAAAARATAERALSRLGLLERREEEAGWLPQAALRRLELARALALRPRLLLLDEPTAGLSPTDVDAVCSLLRQLRCEGITILAVEHDLRAVLSFADAAFFLHQGSVLCTGAPDEVLADRRILQCYLGSGAS
jgi:branched-chain amino acid transport system ATP-binding protein